MTPRSAGGAATWSPRGTRGAVLCGALIGAAAVALEAFGNPPNMGICEICFERDIVGATVRAPSGGAS